MAATPRKRNLFFFFLGFLATDSSGVVSVALSLGVVSTSEFREHHGHLLPKAGGLIRSVTGILRALSGVLFIYPAVSGPAGTSGEGSSVETRLFLRMSIKTVGTKNRVAPVAKIRPPITAPPTGALCS